MLLSGCVVVAVAPLAGVEVLLKLEVFDGVEFDAEVDGEVAELWLLLLYEPVLLEADGYVLFVLLLVELG